MTFKVPYVEVSLAAVAKNINKDEPLGFDVETVGKYGRIRLAQFYQSSWSDVLLVNNPDPVMLAAMLQDQHFLAHSASYECTTIQRACNATWIPSNFDDTLYLARLQFYARDAFSFDQVVKYVTGEDQYERQGLNKKLMQKCNWDVPALTSEQKLYAATDAYFLPDVYEACKSKLESISYQLDMLNLKASLDFQNNGVPVLVDEVGQQYKANLKELEELDVPINVNSWQQVRPYIGENDSDGLALATFSLQGNQKAAVVRKARTLLKQNSFLNKFDVPEARIYGVFKPGARSGRGTCDDQNLQQLPRKLKHVFGYHPGDGMALTYADYAQLEMRTIAAITGDANMCKILMNNEDLHDFTAKMLFGENFTPLQRQIAKTCNFNLLYGGGAAMLRSILIKDANILVQQAEASAYKTKWGNVYPAVKSWQNKGIHDYHHGVPWVTPFGRAYKARLMMDQLNIQNQGAGAEVAKLSIHYMYEEYKDVYEPQGCKYINFVHDAHVFENPDDPAIYEPLADLVARAMQEAWFEFLRSGRDLKVRDLPMPVDVFVGYNWGRIEKEAIYKLTVEGMKYAA